MNTLLTWNLLYLIYLQILVQHIKAILPGLKSRISSALVSVAKEHASYGEITESKACLILSRDCVKLGWDHCSINWIFIACFEVVNFVLGITADFKFAFYSSSVECWMSFFYFCSLLGVHKLYFYFHLVGSFCGLLLILFFFTYFKVITHQVNFFFKKCLSWLVSFLAFYPLVMWFPLLVQFWVWIEFPFLDVIAIFH